MKKKNVVIAGIASLVAIAAAAFFVVKRRTNKEDRPPKGAPQLDLNNPGDQSNFPAGPTGEGELG